MLKPGPISGFPEWTPAQRLKELEVLDTIRRVYELYGYASLETAAVEKVEVLQAKGVEGKELYGLERLAAESGAEKRELALHFDLTVPLARYVAQNYGVLSFPYKRYQIQKVWRGERPAQGRFREFYQADIDVIAEDDLPLHFDAEMPAVVAEVFERLGIDARIRINNRKLLLGYYQGLGLSDEQIPLVLREVDKLEKIGPDKVTHILSEMGIAGETIKSCLGLAEARSLADLRGMSSHELFEKGLAELEFVADSLAHLDDRAIIDPGIVRGLDYYTGSIYEVVLPEHPALGSICSGGRYEDLASEFIKRKLPGVGISIGVSRLLSYLFTKGGWNPTRSSPTEVLVVLPSAELRQKAYDIARQLRAADVPAEVYHEPAKLDKQVRYADRKQIPYVMFPFTWPESVEVKELATGQQVTVSLNQWLEARS